MTTKKDVLDLKARRTIYSFILKCPGLHLSELCKRLNMHKNNVDYHLKILIKQGLIETSSEDGYTGYYVTKLDGERARAVAKVLINSMPYETEKRLFHIFKYLVPGRKDKRILNLIRRSVPREIIAFLFVHPDSSQIEISRHLKKHHSTVSFHLNKLIKANIIERIPNGNEIRYRIKNEGHLVKLGFLYFLVSVNELMPMVKSKG